MHTKKSGSGFTIVEVLIVLAIAGTIMLVVFLAVPTLQRQSRNNGTRVDATHLASAYLEVVANKSGGVLGPSWSDNNTLGNGSADGLNVLSAANTKSITYLAIGPYATGTITYQDIPFASSNRVSGGGALIRTGSKCAAQSDPTSTAGSPKQIAVYYGVETSSGNQVQCLND